MFMEKREVSCDIGGEFHSVLCIDCFNLIIVFSIVPDI